MKNKLKSFHARVFGIKKEALTAMLLFKKKEFYFSKHISKHSKKFYFNFKLTDQEKVEWKRIFSSWKLRLFNGRA